MTSTRDSLLTGVSEHGVALVCNTYFAFERCFFFLPLRELVTIACTVIMVKVRGRHIDYRLTFKCTYTQ